MALCEKCGKTIEEGLKLCPECQAADEANTAQPQQPPASSEEKDFAAKVAALNDTADTTSEFDAADIGQNKVMAILAYIGLLVLVPIFAAKDSKFARFHANQGLVLLIAGAACGIAIGIIHAIIVAIFWQLFFITSLIAFVVSAAFTILAVLGIVNSANGKAKELPIIGKFKILK